MHNAPRPACKCLAAAAAVLAACTAGPLPALASTPAYVGTWGTDAANCKLPQDQQGAPMVISTKGYDQHEAHCTFASVARKGRVWMVDAQCSIEGDKQKDSFTLQVNGNKLVMAHGNRARTYVRCK